mgnify:FL=1|jgi:hypothetical protein
MKIGNIFGVSPGKTLHAYPPGCFVPSACDEYPHTTAGDSCTSKIVHTGETLLVTETIAPAHNHNPGLVLVLCNGELRSIYGGDLELAGGTE